MRSDKAGNLYFLQYMWGEKVDKEGSVTRFTIPVNANDFCVDSSGNMFVCSTAENRIYKMSISGDNAPVAGSGQTWGPNDLRWTAGDGGLALKASLNSPCSIAVDSAGNLYIAEWGNKRIRKVDAAGLITTIAGGGYLTAAEAEGGPATAIALRKPSAVRINSKGEIFFCDGANEEYPRIFKLYR